MWFPTTDDGILEAARLLSISWIFLKKKTLFLSFVGISDYQCAAFLLNKGIVTELINSQLRKNYHVLHLFN